MSAVRTAPLAKTPLPTTKRTAKFLLVPFKTGAAYITLRMKNQNLSKNLRKSDG